MLSIIDECNLRDIIEFEMFIWMNYKMNPFEMFDYMTMFDLHSYFDILQNKIEERDKNQDGNKNMKMLAAVRDMLNHMNLPEY